MKVYVARQWTNAEGSHEIGAEVEVASGTDDEKAELARLISYGIVSETPVGQGARGGKHA
jgi:hypothetical protein